MRQDEPGRRHRAADQGGVATTRTRAKRRRRPQSFRGRACSEPGISISLARFRVLGRRRAPERQRRASVCSGVSHARLPPIARPLLSPRPCIPRAGDRGHLPARDPAGSAKRRPAVSAADPRLGGAALHRQAAGIARQISLGGRRHARPQRQDRDGVRGDPQTSSGREGAAGGFDPRGRPLRGCAGR